MNEEQTFSLVDYFEAIAKVHPLRTAITMGSTSYTYESLYLNSKIIASYLCEKGIQRGDRVGIHLMNCPEYLMFFLACCFLGAVPFNVNYHYKCEELHYIYSDATPKIIITQEQFRELIKTAIRHIKPLPEIITIEDRTYLKTIETFHEFAPRGDDISLLYTGGTTGLPKGVIWEHHHLLGSAMWGINTLLGVNKTPSPDFLASRVKDFDEYKILILPPLMHGGTLWLCLIGFFLGCQMVLNPHRQFNPGSILNLVDEHQIQSLYLVGDVMMLPIFDEIKKYPQKWTLNSLIRVMNSAASLSDNLKKQFRCLFPQIEIVDSFGTSEAGVLGQNAKDSEGQGVFSLESNPDYAVIVSRNRFATPGETGHLARSGHISSGYWGDKKKTDEQYLMLEGRRFVLTGDIAKMNLNGEITLLGREGVSINTGGEKVFVEEVEDRIKQYENIKDVVVLGTSDKRWGERVVALVSLMKPELMKNESNYTQDLIDFCKKSLANYKVPKDVFFLPEIIRSPNGKQDYLWAKKTLTDILGDVS